MLCSIFCIFCKNRISPFNCLEAIIAWGADKLDLVNCQKDLFEWKPWEISASFFKRNKKLVFLLKSYFLRYQSNMKFWLHEVQEKNLIFSGNLILSNEKK